jgi:hypothetical protein
MALDKEHKTHRESAVITPGELRVRGEPAPKFSVEKLDGDLGRDGLSAVHYRSRFVDDAELVPAICAAEEQPTLSRLSDFRQRQT